MGEMFTHRCPVWGKQLIALMMSGYWHSKEV